MATSTAPQGLPVVRAAGGIVLKSTPRGNEVMLVYRKRHQDWTLPKGKLKEGESFQEAALREVAEETGCACDLGTYAGTISYAYNGVPKVVMFWKMLVIEEKTLQDNDEISEAVWMPVAAAIQRLTHAQEKSLLTRLTASQKTAAAEPQSPEPTAAPPPAAALEGAPPRRATATSVNEAATALLREMETFTIELGYLERRNSQAGAPWAVAAREHLDHAEHLLAENDVASARRDFYRAQRYSVMGMDHEELVTRAQILREEAANHSSWRAAAIQQLLALPDEKLTAARVADAMGLRDEDAISQDGADRHVREHIQGLIAICVLGAVGLAFSFLLTSSVQEVAPSVFFAMIGAAISMAYLVLKRKNDPRTANLLPMLLTVLLGSVSGLAATPVSEYLAATLRLRAQPAALQLALAFLFGCAAQRLLVRFAIEPRESSKR